MLKSSLFLILAAPLILGGCISVKTSNDQPAVIDGGIYKTADSGTTWNQAVLIPTVTGKPLTLSNTSIIGLYPDPSDHLAMYAAVEGEGIYYTLDGAKSWQHLPVFGKGAPSALAVDPADKCEIFAALANRLMVTSDCGRTWKETYYDSDAKAGISTVVIPSDRPASILLGNTRGDLVRSDNNGQSWSTIFRFQADLKRIVQSSVDKNLWYAGTDKKGIFRSTDGGQTWTEIKDSLKDFKDSRSFIEIIPSAKDANTVHFATTHNYLLSKDRGDSWDKVELIPPDKNVLINTIAVNPKDDNDLYYLTDGGIFRSIDAGKTWTPKKLPTTRIGWRLLIDPAEPATVYMAVKSPKKR